MARCLLCTLGDEFLGEGGETRCPPCTLAKASTEDSLALPSCSRAGAATGGAEPMELIFLPGTALCLAWVSAMKSI